MKLVLEIAILAALCVVVSAKHRQSRLKVGLYYEALCPYCQTFITDELYPAYQKIGSSLILQLVPYGNAERKKVDGVWQFDCQHGELECKLNMVEACGIAKSRDQGSVLEFVKCIEEEDGDDSERANICSDALGLSADVILKCSRGAEGIKLFAKLGAQTDAVRPEIEGVPTITFNNRNDAALNEKARENFLKTACELLHNQPEGCQ